jgi:hypothetical protein
MPPDFRERVLAKLREKGVRPQCELCGANDWNMVEQPVMTVVASGSGAFALPPPHIPSVALICKNCGNTRLLALGALDLFPDLESRQLPVQHPVGVS